MRKLIVAILAIASVCSAQTNSISLAQTHVAGVNLQTGTSYSILSTDRSKLVSFNNASPVAVTLPQATGSFATGFMFWAQNIGAGTATITPTTSTIDGQSSMTLTQYQGVWIVSNGTNWYSTRGAASGGSGTVMTTGSPSSGNLAKFSGATSITNGDLSGDATTSGTLAVTVAKVNGVAYSASPSTDTVPVITASNTSTYKAVPDCQDTSGSHLNYTASTHVFSCGATAGATGGGGSSAIQTNGSNAAATVNFNNSTPVPTDGSGYDNENVQSSVSGGTTSVSFQHNNYPRTIKYAFAQAVGNGWAAFVGDSNATCGPTPHSTGDNTNPPNSTLATSTTNGNTNSCNGQAEWRVGHGLYMMAILKPSATTAVRYCVGFQDNGSGANSTTCSDTMNGLHAIGFMYSTTLSHTVWNCYKNNATANISTASSPAISVDTSQYSVFEVEESLATPGTFNFYITPLSSWTPYNRTQACSSLASGISSGSPLNVNVAVSCLTCSPTANNFKMAYLSMAQTWK